MTGTLNYKQTEQPILNSRCINSVILTLPDNEDDFCEAALQQRQINLPESCAQPGRNTTLYEVGDCASKTCRQASANAIEQCSDSSKSCCIPSRVETKSINCTGYELELIVVKACSCGSCDTAVSVQVSGKVVSAKAGSPVEYAEVWLNGEFEMYTSYTGSFYVTVTDSIDKAVFTVKDTYNNMYLDTTKVVEISAGVGGTISVTIQMLEMSTPVIIDSTVETVLSMNRVQNESSSPIALLKVPANSFYRGDGSAYTGMVSSIVTFIDPTDDNIQDAVPGVFQFIDEEGSTIDLASKGIFNLQFQDENGEALFVDGLIEVSFPDQAASDFTLWKLNTVSGLWEPLTPSIETNRRKRRQAKYVIGEIDMSTLTVRSLCNIDTRFYRSSGSRCYFKTRLYKDESFSEQIKNDNAKYNVGFRRVAGRELVQVDFGYLSDWRLASDCFLIPCDNKVAYFSLKTYHLYSHLNRYTYMHKFIDLNRYTYKLIAAQPLLTEHDLQYEILESSSAIGIITTSSDYGPFYKDINRCRVAGVTESHLRFRKATTPDIYTARYFSPGGLPIGENRKLMDKVWYPKRESLHMMCFIKVKVSFRKSLLSPESSLKFHVFSFGGVLPEVRDFLFGIREFEVNISETSGYICAEYKCSGKLEQSDKEDYTRVQIAIASSTSYICQIQAISENIKSLQFNDKLNDPSWLQSRKYFDAYIPDSYGSSWGVYEAHTSSKDFETTRDKVHDECMESYDQQNGGAAVHLYYQMP